MAEQYEIPEKVINFNMYNSAEKLIGITGEVKLPTLEEMTETMSGAGILGEYESGTPGHFGSMETEIPFSLVSKYPMSLMTNDFKVLFLRGAKQVVNLTTGEKERKSLKITLKGSHKSTDLGKAAVAGKMETTGKIEILYIKIETDGITILELDKLNFVYVVNGVDQLADIKAMM